jgi:N-acyl-D-amino-acid deacylase
MTLEEGVRVSTSLPAEILDLPERGVLREGAAGDVVVFDPERIRDMADAFEPHRYAEGIDFVLVNGEIAVDGGRPLGVLAGRVLLRAGAEPGSGGR